VVPIEITYPGTPTTASQVMVALTGTFTDPLAGNVSTGELHTCADK